MVNADRIECGSFHAVTSSLKHRAFRVACSLFWAALVVAAACGTPEDPMTGPRRIPSLADVVGHGSAAGFNLVLISVDTLRQDRLGCYGYARAETPAMDGLGDHGVRFGDAVTSVPVTLPSHATMMTGLSPLRHGVRDNGAYFLDSSHGTLAEALQQAGYTTSAFVGSFVLDARFGLDQGFDVYDFQVGESGYRSRMPDFNERDAESVTTAALDWFEHHSAQPDAPPFFVWLHYFDPHLPYHSPFANLSRFAGRPYDAEIAYVDEQIGRFVEALERMGHQQDTLVALVSDHGEALGDHGESTHGMLLYESTIRVPMILSGRGLFDGAYTVDNQVVGLVDLRPTLEDLLGLSSDEEMDGSSLIRTTEDPDRSIYLETHMPFTLARWSPLHALRRHSQKYIEAPTPELYDLAADPAEVANLLEQTPKLGADLSGRLAEMMKADPGAEATREIDDAERKRLEALGYVHRDSESPAAIQNLADPKAMMPIHAMASRAEKLYGQGRFEEAAALAAQVVDSSPDSVLALRILAFSNLKLGRGDEAIHVLRAAVDRGAGVFIVRTLAQALILEKRYDEAERVIDLYETIAPRDGRVPLLRGDILDRRGETEAAIVQYRRAIELDEVRTGRMARGRIERIRQRSIEGQ